MLLYIIVVLKKSYLGVSTKFDFFLLISFFLLLLFLPFTPPLPSLLLHLSLPLWFPTLWGGAGFPAQKLAGFWEEPEDLNRDWNQLVCHLIQEGETWAKTKALILGLSLQPGGAGSQNPKVSQKGPVLGIGHQGSPKDRGPPRLPMVGMLGSGPGSGCPGDLSVTTASSKRARGTPDRTPVSPLASARSQIPGFASGESIKTRTGFGQIFLSHHERPAIECTERLCAYMFLNYQLLRNHRDDS